MELQIAPRNTATQIAGYRELAAAIARQLPAGSSVLEVAAGSGYFAITLARRGRYRVTGLDACKTFVRMAAENARWEGVEVDFVEGDLAAMPFEAGSFDLIVCRAACQNFAEPVRALREMHRVLRPGGRALILDLKSAYSEAEVRQMASEALFGCCEVRADGIELEVALSARMRRDRGGRR